MRKLTWLAVFETGDGPGISVYFPDIPGCVTCGDDFDHALAMAKEALALHICGMEKDGEALPARTDKAPGLAPGDMVVPVTIFPDMVREETGSRREKTAVTIPHWLKAAAEAEDLDCSRLLEAAIITAPGIGHAPERESFASSAG